MADPSVTRGTCPDCRASVWLYEGLEIDGHWGVLEPHFPCPWCGSTKTPLHPSQLSYTSDEPLWRIELGRSDSGMDESQVSIDRGGSSVMRRPDGGLSGPNFPDLPEKNLPAPRQRGQSCRYCLEPFNPRPDHIGFINVCPKCRTHLSRLTRDGPT